MTAAILRARVRAAVLGNGWPRRRAREARSWRYRAGVAMALASLVGGTAAAAAAERIVIRNVTVVDARGGLRANRDVVVEGERIVAVSAADGTVRRGDQAADGTGGFLIPGLWDMHVHFVYDPRLTGVMGRLFLDHGVTSVRDTGGATTKLVEVRAAAGAGADMPDVYISGPLLDGRHVVYDGGDPGRPPLGIATPSVAAAHARVAELAAWRPPAAVAPDRHRRKLRADRPAAAR